jgi:cyclohexyl-isocyanide hydratase
MTITRRSINKGVAGLLATPLLGATAASVHAQAPAVNAQASPPQASAASHDMSAMPAHWMGKEQIAFLIYPEFTALDMVGPHYMMTSLMGATVHVVAKTKEPVRSDTGLVFTPSVTFDECPKDLDIICVPGGTLGTLAAMQDEATIAFLRDRGSRGKIVTSVCTGSLVLGAAGLLDGYEATSHWAVTHLLPIFGAKVRNARVVKDRNRITGGGVTAGIDFGLSLVGQLRDRTYAEGVQLIAEYAPEPPFNAGTPERAPVEIKTIVESMFTGFIQQAEAVSREAFAKVKRT